MTEAQERKERVVAELREVMPRYLERLGRIDERMVEYARDLVRSDIDVHNEDELLGFRKFLRLLDTYPYDYERVKDVLYDAEGEWEPERPDNPDRSANPESPEGRTANLRHVRGGMVIDGIYGARVYRQTPMQVFVYAWVYGFSRIFDTQSLVGSRVMLPSERAGAEIIAQNLKEKSQQKYASSTLAPGDDILEGSPAARNLNKNQNQNQEENIHPDHIYDRRSLVQKFVCLWPRKMAKTFTSSFILFEDLMRGERDSEDYIATNGSEQSKVLFGMCVKFLHNLDGWKRYFRVSDNDQHRFIKWKADTGRTASITALSSNPKNMDGKKATKIAADEFGAATRVRGNAADMEKLVQVLEGSQGPIREPLTFHSSTAGTGLETPYEQMIGAIHQTLIDELKIPLDGKPHKTDYDLQGCILLRPDEWERGDEEQLRTERVIRKVNPNVGVTIQPDYYQREWKEAEIQGEVKRKEVITKLYNVFCTDMAKQWVTGDKVRSLMRPLRIEDCTEDEGWQIFCGIDFALMADLNIVAMLARRRREDGRMQYHAGLRAYMSEDGIRQNTNKALLEKFVERGWLSIVRADDDFYMLPVRAIEELLDKGLCIVGVGYDPYKASKPINELKDYLFAEFGANDPKICDIVKPVRQSFANFNPLVIEMDYMLNGEGGREDDPMLTFEENGLWSYCFSNCFLAESADGMANRKPIKRDPSSKIDAVIGLMESLAMADYSDGKIYDVGEE